MPDQSNQIDFGLLGRRDGESAARDAIAFLVAEGGEAFKPAVARALAAFNRLVAGMGELGGTAAEIAAFRAGWVAGFDCVLDELGAQLVGLLPDDDCEDEDD